MYSDTSGLSGLRGIIAVSSILLAPCLVLTFWTFRPARPRYLTAPWYLLWLANLCLIGVHLTGIVIAAIMWKRGPGPSPYAWAQYHTNWSERYIVLAISKTVTLCTQLYSLLVVITCRAAFWEHTNAHDVFRQHNTARWILLAFDILLGMAGLATMLTDLGVGGPCCEGSSQSAGDLMISGVIDEWFSLGFPYIIVAGYINATFGAFFLRKWAKRYDFGVPIANAMFTVISPALLVQTLLLIVATIVYCSESIRNDIIVFYATIPWRIQQIVVLGLVTWVLRNRPLQLTDEQNPKNMPLASQIARPILPAFAI